MLSYDPVSTEQKHDEYCDMFLAHCACNRWAGADAREYGLRYVSVFIQAAGAGSPWDGKYNIHDNCENRSPINCTDSSQWRSLGNCSCEMKGTYKLKKFRTRILSQVKVLEVLHRTNTYCPLQTYFCEWLRSKEGANKLLWHKCLFEIRRFLCTWELDQGPQVTARVRDVPHSTLECWNQFRFRINVWGAMVVILLQACICYLTGWLPSSTLICLKLFYWTAWTRFSNFKTQEVASAHGEDIRLRLNAT